MKENQNSFDSRKIGKETDPPISGSNDRYELNDSRMDANLTELEPKDTDEWLNFKVADDSYMDNGNGKMDSPKVADQNGVSHHLSMDDKNGTIDSCREESKDGLSHQISICYKDTDSLSSDSSDVDKEQRSSEHDSFDTVEEFADCNESDSRDSSYLLFTDENVLECDVPEFEVCYKEIDCQILKDICVDEGRLHEDVNVIEKPGCLLPQPSNETNHLEAKEDSSLDQYQSLEENYGKKLISQERLHSCIENSLEKDTVEHSEPMNAEEGNESYYDATDKAELDSSVEDSIVDMKLPIEDYSTRSSLELDGRNKVIKLPDQILNQEAVPESPSASKQEAGDTVKDVEGSSPLYSSKVETGSITFHFSVPEGVVVSNGTAEDVVHQCGEPENAHKDVLAENLQHAEEEKAHCTSNRVVDSHEQPLSSKEGNSEGNEGNSEGVSATSFVQSVGSESSSSGNAHEGSLHHNQANDVHATDLTPPNHDERDSGEVPVSSQLQHDVGEASFSRASMITYTGPIAFSGSLSHRSDGSATSTRSFAFPILQSEWNSSPVRMAKADRRHFRKHKSWRSGLLCCRF